MLNVFLKTRTVYEITDHIRFRFPFLKKKADSSLENSSFENCRYLSRPHSLFTLLSLPLNGKGNKPFKGLMDLPVSSTG